MENRNGLIVDLRVEQATGYAERSGALAMLDESLPNQDGVTLGADAGYDTSDFVAPVASAGSRRTLRDQRYAPALGGGRPDDQAPRICSQPADPEADRGDIRLGEDRRLLPEDEVQRAGPHAARHLVAAAYNLLRISKLVPA